MLFTVCVKDTAANMFAQPMFVPHTIHAVRSFEQEVNRQDDRNQLYNHSGDFELWLIAQFDEETGTFLEVRERLVRGVDCKNLVAK